MIAKPRRFPVTRKPGFQVLLVALLGQAPRQLLVKHGAIEALRTLDALQLSTALGLKHAGIITVFVAADPKLLRMAALERFAVMNPEQPASIVI
jgi:hypothetical protein